MKPQAPTPDEQARAVAALRAFSRPEMQGSKDWANRLRFRELSGERLTPYQRNAWREALGATQSVGKPAVPYESTT